MTIVVLSLGNHSRAPDFLPFSGARAFYRCFKFEIGMIRMRTHKAAVGTQEPSKVGSSLPAYWQLLMRYAVLIDGGFVKRRLGSRARPTAIADVTGFLERLKAHPMLEGMQLHRIYWYDALPLLGSAVRPLKGGRVDFGRTTHEHADLDLQIAVAPRERAKPYTHAA